jgi:hypothetical protein
MRKLGTSARRDDVWFYVFKQTTVSAAPATVHAVADANNVVVRSCSTRYKADRLVNNFNETKRLMKRGADPKIAFPPYVDVGFLVSLVARTTHLQAIELKAKIPEGSTIKQTDIAPAHWTRRENWSLREV